MSLLSQLEKKNANIESLVEKALKDEKALSEVIGGVSSGKARIKYGCAKVLRIIGERNPEVLYPRWDLFANMLSSENTFLKCDAVFILGHLTGVDSENKFEKLFGKFYKLLDDESMITAANLIGVSKVVAKSKPQLQSKITDKLLSIDETHHGSECKNVLKGHLILTLDSYFKESKEKKRILDFVRKELKNTRPPTRKKAQEFLKKWQT